MNTKYSKLLRLIFIFMIALCTLIGSGARAEGENIALGADTSEFSPGWGGGSYPWEMVDGLTYYSDTWAHGLAFTGGFPGWIEPCGWRQATLNFGEPKTFGRALVWHHGGEHIPTIYTLEYWDGAAWLPVGGTSSVRYDLEMPPAGVDGWGAVPTEHIFPAVTGSKIRFMVNNCDIQHGWIYEFEVFAPEAIQVSIDIKPGKLPNRVNPTSTGVVEVAVLTTPDFNAALVDRASVRFGPGAAAPWKSGFIDVDGDGDKDLLFLFNIQDTGIQCVTTSATLTGYTTAGEAFTGMDFIVVYGCK